MPTKSTKSAKPDIRQMVVDVALRLAARRDWDRVTLKDIARNAKISLADLSAAFDGKEDILAAYGRRVDQDVLASYPDGVPGSEDKDRIFDCLMERFERMNGDRAALTSIIRASCTDPKQIVISMPGVARSMLWTLEICGIDTGGWRGAARVAGLTGVYLWVLRTWIGDDSEDMARTMAALDRALDRCSKWSESLGF